MQRAGHPSDEASTGEQASTDQAGPGVVSLDDWMEQHHSQRELGYLSQHHTDGTSSQPHGEVLTSGGLSQGVVEDEDDEDDESEYMSDPEPRYRCPAGVKGQIIITGDLMGLMELVTPLRQASQQDIVVLSPAQFVAVGTGTPAAGDWDRTCRRYKGLYLIDGSPLRPDDLLRAGLPFASVVVVLSSASGASPFGFNDLDPALLQGMVASSGGENQQGTAQAWADLSAIFTACTVLTRNRRRELRLAKMRQQQNRLAKVIGPQRAAARLRK